MFGEAVPDHVLSWLLQDRQHPIFELELLPVWVAFTVWQGLLSDKQVVLYLDNDAARGALVAGHTEGRAGQHLVSQCVRSEAGHRKSTWYGRVPTHSNISDGPSRLVFDHPLLRGVERLSVPWDRFDFP